MKPFSLLIKPASADCNLRCDYCFYIDRCGLYPSSTRHRMTEDILENLIKSFMATGQSQYIFGWQGGEPTLMGVDFFKRVTELQRKYGDPGSVVSNGLQTNGTLINDEFAKHLADYNFLVGISLDGPPSIHDYHRKYINSRGSHADVMIGIGFLRRHKVEFNILTLITSINAGCGGEIYRYLCSNGFFFHQYIECVEFDDKGNLMPFAVTGKAWGDFLCEIYDEWFKNDVEKVSIRLFDSILGLLINNTVNVCQMGRDCRQYLVVEHNGDIYPCDFFVSKEWKLGNIMDGSWTSFIKSPLYKKFGKRKLDISNECENCEYLRFCAGCCQKNRRGKEGQQLSVLCEGWKQFYKHSIIGFEYLAEKIKEERVRHMTKGDKEKSSQPGRNCQCPCGSGKKYKRCCGSRIEWVAK